jgi:hypothetical protein
MEEKQYRGLIEVQLAGECAEQVEHTLRQLVKTQPQMLQFMMRGIRVKELVAQLPDGQSASQLAELLNLPDPNPADDPLVTIHVTAPISQMQKLAGLCAIDFEQISGEMARQAENTEGPQLDWTGEQEILGKVIMACQEFFDPVPE